MKLVQLKNHRENKQTVQKRHRQYSRSGLRVDNHAGTKVTSSDRTSIAPAGHPHRYIHPQARRMQLSDMIIDSSSSLRAPVALGVIEIKGVDSEFANGAFERDTAVQRFGGVVAHTLIIVFCFGKRFGQEELALRVLPARQPVIAGESRNG